MNETVKPKIHPKIAFSEGAAVPSKCGDKSLAPVAGGSDASEQVQEKPSYPPGEWVGSDARGFKIRGKAFD